LLIAYFYEIEKSSLVFHFLGIYINKTSGFKVLALAPSRKPARLEAVQKLIMLSKPEELLQLKCINLD